MLLNRNNWLLGITNLGFILAMYTVTFWFPQAVKEFGFTSWETGFIVAGPQIAGAFAIFLWGRSRRLRDGGPKSLYMPLAVVAASMAVASLGLALSRTWLTIGALTISTAAIYAAIPAFWTLVTRMIQGANAAAKIAFVSTIGSLSGVIDPPMVGFIKDHTNSLSGGFAVSTAFLLLAIVTATFVHSAHRANSRNAE